MTNETAIEIGASKVNRRIIHSILDLCEESRAITINNWWVCVILSYFGVIDFQAFSSLLFDNTRLDNWEKGEGGRCRNFENMKFPCFFQPHKLCWNEKKRGKINILIIYLYPSSSHKINLLQDMCVLSPPRERSVWYQMYICGPSCVRLLVIVFYFSLRKCHEMSSYRESF